MVDGLVGMHCHRLDAFQHLLKSLQVGPKAAALFWNLPSLESREFCILICLCRNVILTRTGCSELAVSLQVAWVSAVGPSRACDLWFCSGQ